MFDVAAGARQIAELWRTGEKIAVLPDGCRPADLAGGYAIQSALGAALADASIGWKIAATSAEGRKHIGVDTPLVGRLFEGRLLADGAHVSLRGNAMRVAECEFVFRLGRDLPAQPRPYDETQVLAAIASLHPGIELPDSRFEVFARAGAAQLAADNACANWMLIGPATQAPWRDADLAAHETCLRVNGTAVSQGRGADVLGGPLQALTWLANNHAVHGAGLRAGDWVTTGVTGLPSALAPGDVVEADLGPFGRVRAFLDC